MSHRDDCPDRWEARREGERAVERGWGHYSSSNPYRSGSDHECPEASRAWEDGRRAAEYRAEEQREQDAVDLSAQHQRELAEIERAEYEAAYQQEQQQEEPTPETTENPQ